jgi:DNA-binding transcriptional regulator YhcF (GntR family)
MPRTRIPKIMQMAEVLEQDIRKRGLKPGDRYMTAAEVASFLNVSATTANRVLQILAGRDVVERAQKRGTIVSNPFPERPLRTIEKIHMITFQENVKQTGLMTDPVVVGIQNVLQGCMIQFNFLSPLGREDDLGRLLQEVGRAGSAVGIVLTKSTYQAQRMVEQSGIPAVVHGYPQPSIGKMAWLTVDYEKIGSLAGGHFAKQKVSSAVQLLPERPMLPGDYRLQGAMKKVMSEKGYDAESFHVCCLPYDPEVLRAWFGEQFRGSDGKCGIITNHECLSSVPMDKLRKLAPGRGLCDVVIIDEHKKAGSQLPKGSPRIHGSVSDFEVGRHIARLLLRQMDGENGQLSEILPVKLTTG